jgi:hypothetical protein
MKNGTEDRKQRWKGKLEGVKNGEKSNTMHFSLISVMMT